jgi:hypothetical protein
VWIHWRSGDRMSRDGSVEGNGRSPTPNASESPIPPTALVMPGPSWALSNVKDAVPLDQRAALYSMLAESKQYAQIEDLPDPWRGRAFAEYRIWQNVHARPSPGAPIAESADRENSPHRGSSSESAAGRVAR